jgi:hypothetical protein
MHFAKPEQVFGMKIRRALIVGAPGSNSLSTQRFFL